MIPLSSAEQLSVRHCWVRGSSITTKGYPSGDLAVLDHIHQKKVKGGNVSVHLQPGHSGVHSTCCLDVHLRMCCFIPGISASADLLLDRISPDLSKPNTVQPIMYLFFLI